MMTSSQPAFQQIRTLTKKLRLSEIVPRASKFRGANTRAAGLARHDSVE